MYSEFLVIRRAFEQVWLLRAEEKGMEGCLAVFDKAGTQLGETVKWLAAQREAVAGGHSADATLKTYKAGNQYEILWTANFKNMWDRGYPWR